MRHKTTCRVVRNGRGGNEAQKLQTKEIKVRLNYSKEGGKKKITVQ
jgi:hypothetical protein